ncbi:hypothetical protein GFS24_18735 [Chitinophaga sp. SYP-B3965]|uniref:DUF2071 domain-containing protein n=1 Tax=Chitinophaga sp. SYP-B3965 TaxID=2663120 RepID=UPI0012999117|nr:DUF2071 domain-containing protein [Chitinophaga sp. SYP-B3965]MRG47165.1 hypothetical protein [Chitinophaga sp. SYP-B3965]
MNFPAIHGLIDRRILINFTADPDAVQQILPAPFRPKIYKGKAIVGVCLIRLKNIKPKGFPDLMGIGSENGAHRIAVEWDEEGETKEGVYVPRRDTSSRLNAFAGGRIFPGKHYLAKFNVKEANGNYHVNFTSSDNTNISIDAKTTDQFPPGSIFQTLESASDFFKKGSLGYSPDGNKFQGLKLHINEWKVQPLEVLDVHSSFFENETLFKKDTVHFDNALLMTKIEHEWHSAGSK